MHRECRSGDEGGLGYLNLGLADPSGADDAAFAVRKVPVGRHAMTRRVLGNIGVVKVRNVVIPVVGLGRPG